MRSLLYGNIARQVALGRGALRALSRSQANAPYRRSGKDRRLPISTAVPLWGVLSIIGWLLAANLTMGLLNADERRQLASPGGAAPADGSMINFITAAGAAER